MKNKNVQISYSIDIIRLFLEQKKLRAENWKNKKLKKKGFLFKN